MPKGLSVLFLALALGMCVMVPTRRLNAAVQYERGYEFVFTKRGKVEWDRLGFQAAILGLAAGIVAVVRRKDS